MGVARGLENHNPRARPRDARLTTARVRWH
jgi:hypothetical protein